MDEATRAYLALALTPGLGPRKIKLLTDHFGDAERVYQADIDELRSVPGVGDKLARAIDEARHSDAPERELKRVEMLGVRLLHLAHPDYPEVLRNIFDPPPVLYVRGSLPQALRRSMADVRSIAVVGTRDPSAHAVDLGRRIARDLAEAGVVIVSGMALGIDAAAHEGALQASEGATVAVLGSGVDVLYPQRNRKLAERLLDRGGAIVSEYSIGSAPKAENFPARNRVISGLSRGVVVVEAGAKSGAMITADFAGDQGRAVFAVPGRVGDPRAAGTLGLLKQGAVITSEAQDVLADFGWDPAVAIAPSPAAELAEDQREVVDAIARIGSPLLDDLIAATGRPAPQLLPMLTLLELRGVVKCVPGGRYIALLS